MDLDRRQVLGTGLAGMVGLAAAPGIAATAAPARAPVIRPLTVKGVTIGTGRPKLLVSITEKTFAAALVRARALAAMPEIDILEYRIDHLDDHADPAAVAASVAEVAGAAGAKPLLLTFRTKAEGGEAAIAPDAYAALYAAALARGGADMIDLQFALCSAPPVAAVFRDGQARGIPAILSYHNFHATPPVAEMVAKLRAMQAYGGAIPKVAVMPQDAGDTIALLQATWDMHSRYADRPILTMAMAGTGAISRVAGEVFGSALTFGAVGDASAPGQIDASHLRPMLDTLAAALA